MIKQIIKFRLNGELYETNTNLNLKTLIYYFDYSKSNYILEHNLSICDSENWSNLFIKDNDKIELITIVGGG